VIFKTVNSVANLLRIEAWNEGIKTDPTGVTNRKKKPWADSGKSWGKRTLLPSVKTKKLRSFRSHHVTRHNIV